VANLLVQIYAIELQGIFWCYSVSQYQSHD
jgi:hypothetical protein